MIVMVLLVCFNLFHDMSEELKGLLHDGQVWNVEKG